MSVSTVRRRPTNATVLKAPLTGPIDRFGGTHLGATNTFTGGDLQSATNFTDSVSTRSKLTGCVINADWATLEPTKKNNWNFSSIDDGITQAAAAGCSAYLLRIFAGRYMPGWILADNSNALSISHFYGDVNTPSQAHFGTSAQSGDSNWTGTSFSGTDYFSSPDANTNGAMPKWWDARLADHYYRLMSEVAARYESVTAVRQVQMTMVTSYYGEPMIHQRFAKDGNSANVNYATVRAQGWTEDAESSAFTAMFQIHQACFSRTRSGLACNPAERYHDTNDTAYTNSIDPEYTRELVMRARSIVGDPLVITQHSLQYPRQTSGSNCWLHTTTDRYTDMFNMILDNATFPRRGFQTNPTSNLGSSGSYTTAQRLVGAVTDAATMGGTYVELPSGYHSYLASTDFDASLAALTANADGTAAP